MLNRVFWLALIGTFALIVLVISILPKSTEQIGKQINSDQNHNYAHNYVHNYDYDLKVLNVTAFIKGHYVESMSVAIKDGYIVQVASAINGSAAITIDGTDKVLVPGLVDAHTHSFGNALQDAINFGVTSHFDMFSPSTALSNHRQNRDDVDYMQSDLFSAGMLATAVGGHGTQFGLAIDTLEDASEAESWVARRKKEGSDYIKLVYMTGTNHFESLDLETCKAIINAAHDQGMLAMAHIFSQSDAKDMVAAGIDGLVHQFADSLVSQEFLDLAIESNLFVIPTLAVIASITGNSNGAVLAESPMVSTFLSASAKAQLESGFANKEIPGFDFDIALTNTRLMYQAGIPILAGSDAANPGVSWGISLHQEIAYLVEAGLDPNHALQAASELPFKVFGIEAHGKIEKEYRANLLLLNRSLDALPHTSLDINTIIKNGKIVEREKFDVLAANNKNRLSTPFLSDFANSMQGPDGMLWNHTDDSIVNGKSQAAVSNSTSGLTVVTKIEQGFVFPWAGTSLTSQAPFDLNEYSEIEFTISGTPATYRVMLLSNGQTGVPPTQNIEVKELATTLRLKLDNFRNASLERSNGFAWVAGPTIGEFNFILDDVKLHK